MLQAAAVGLAIVATSSVAQAQNVLTQGLSLGLDVSYANVTLKNDDLGWDESEGAMGVGLRAGYGLNRMWQPYVSISRHSFEVQDVDASLQSIDLGTKVNFPLAGKAWVPFADVSYNLRSATLEGDGGDAELDGSTFTLGGGVQWFMNSQWSLDGGLQYQIGKFDEGEEGGESFDDLDIDANTLRLNFGFTWRPMAR
jgi:hypothetical protein